MKRRDTAAFVNALSILQQASTSWDAPVTAFEAVQGHDPFRILIATILSARTNDKTTTIVCERLFKRVTAACNLEEISEAELASLLYPVGFYQTKAQHLKALPGALRERFGGKIPAEIDELITLPGVGRKTANLVRARAFDLPAICVDTHVHRISNWWGYIKTETPEQTEKTLKSLVPQEHWNTINFVLVSLGQTLCKAVSPQCTRCPVAALCAHRTK
jgi:endonuclease III